MLLTNGLNYNRSWGIDITWPAGTILKSIGDLYESGLRFPDLKLELTKDEIQFIRDGALLVLDGSWTSSHYEEMFDLFSKDLDYLNINKNNVLVLTGNLSNNYSTSSGIHNIGVPILAELVYHLRDKVQFNIPSTKFVSLNRNPRRHRIELAQDMIDAKLNCDISFPAVQGRWDNMVVWRDDFMTAPPITFTEDMFPGYGKYSFVVVPEASVGLKNEIGIFITEKTFKPMLFDRPLIIWGQRGVNHFIKELGFKLYDKYFDLSFDLIEDENERRKGLMNVLKSTIIEDPYKWLNRDKETLEYNRQGVLNRIACSKAIIDINYWLKLRSESLL